MHPSVKRKLQQYYQESNYRLYALLGRDFNWCDQESRTAAASASVAGPAAVTAKLAAAAAAAAPPSYEIAVEMPPFLAAESSDASTSSSSSSSLHEAKANTASGAKAPMAQAAKDALRLVAEAAQGNTGGSDAGKGLVRARASTEGSLDGGIKAVPAHLGLV